MAVDNSKKACFKLFMGATECGKSTELQKHLRQMKPSRVLIWDHKGEYTDVQRAASMSELLSMITTKEKKPKKTFKVRFVPGRIENKARKQAFSTMCSIAMHIGDVLIIAEELSFVVNANGGPPGYLEVLSTGRASGVSLFGTSQRPARVDKDLFANSSYIWCGRLGWGPDATVMRDALRVPADDILQLTGHNSIALDKRTGTHYRNGKKAPP